MLLMESAGGTGSLRKCTDNKDPGVDEIIYEYLKNIPENWGPCFEVLSIKL